MKRLSKRIKSLVLSLVLVLSLLGLCGCRKMIEPLLGTCMLNLFS